MLDIHVGLIVDELEKLGLDKNTIVIFTSDNGHEIYYATKGRVEKPYRNMVSGERFDDYTNKYYSELSGDVFNGNASMAGMKRSNLQGGVNVPLTFYYKDNFKPKVTEELVSNYDLLPTFAQMLQVELLSDKDGISFWSLLTHDIELSSDRYVVYGSNYGPAIVENSGWKLRYYRHKDVFELYHIKIDPQERKNIIEDYPEIAEKLKSKLLEECGGNLDNGVNRHG